MAEVNLIPEAVLVAQAQRRHAKGWLILVLVIAALNVLPLVLDWSRRAHAAELRDESGRIQRELVSSRSQLRTTSAEATRIFLEVERARALRSKRAWSSMFALIASCMPSDCWLASVATDPETPAGGAAPQRPAAQAKVAGGERETVTIEAPRKLRIVGYALTDTQPLALVTNLKESLVFENVLLERSLRAPDVSPGESAKSNAALYQFEIVCEW